MQQGRKRDLAMVCAARLLASGTKMQRQAIVLIILDLSQPSAQRDEAVGDTIDAVGRATGAGGGKAFAHGPGFDCRCRLSGALAALMEGTSC
jgi:hypothetical protein